MKIDVDSMINNAQNELARMQESYVRSCRKYDDEIMIRQGRGEESDDLQRFIEWVNYYKRISEQAIRDLQASIEGMTILLLSDEYKAYKRARAALEHMRDLARDAWLQNGGDRDSFQLAWPEIERDILTKRVLRELEDVMIEVFSFPPADDPGGCNST